MGTLEYCGHALREQITEGGVTVSERVQIDVKDHVVIDVCKVLRHGA